MTGSVSLSKNIAGKVFFFRPDKKEYYELNTGREYENWRNIGR